MAHRLPQSLKSVAYLFITLPEYVIYKIVYIVSRPCIHHFFDATPSPAFQDGHGDGSRFREADRTDPGNATGTKVLPPQPSGRGVRGYVPHRVSVGVHGRPLYGGARALLGGRVFVCVHACRLHARAVSQLGLAAVNSSALCINPVFLVSL